MHSMHSHDAIPPGPHDADEEPHDVLAAEEFAMPAPEHRADGPLVLPPDPTGDDSEPHDILAAEQFPMPAPPRRA
jgi:hypothetical protein